MEPQESDHPIEHEYCLSFFKRPAGSFNPEEYSEHVQPIAYFRTVSLDCFLYNYNLLLVRIACSAVQ